MPISRFLAVGITALTLAALVLLGLRIYQDASTHPAIQQDIQTLPLFDVTTLEGHPAQSTTLSTEQPLALVYFTTTCPFCQAEVRSLTAHAELLDTARVALISPEPVSILEQFVQEYELDRHGSIQVLQDTDDAVAQTFGLFTVPHTFIYDANHRLLRSFQGETSAATIYRALLSDTNSQPLSSSTGDCLAADSTIEHGDCTIR